MTITECRQSTSTKQYIGLAVLLSDTVSHVFRGKCQFAVTRQILSGTCQESMRYCHDHCFRSFFSGECRYDCLVGFLLHSFWIAAFGDR